MTYQRFFPFRLIRLINQYDLVAGWSFDFIIMDEHDTPWDFSKNDIETEGIKQDHKRLAHVHSGIINVHQFLHDEFQLGNNDGQRQSKQNERRQDPLELLYRSAQSAT